MNHTTVSSGVSLICLREYLWTIDANMTMLRVEPCFNVLKSRVGNWWVVLDGDAKGFMISHFDLYISRKLTAIEKWRLNKAASGYHI